MTPFHIFLAVLVAVIWGIAFVATKLNTALGPRP